MKKTEYREMRKIINLINLSLLCSILIIKTVFAVDYYVDAAKGNDTNIGMGYESAWKTIAKVNNKKFSPGDRILFKRGEIWREELVFDYSSGAEGNHIIVSAYGEGENPVINGADIIAGWSVYKENIYCAEVSSEATQLFIDGKRQIISRWPNQGWVKIGTNAKNSISLYSESLIQPDNYWVGSNIVIRPKPWAIYVRKVVSNINNLITWDQDIPYPAEKNYGFYIEGNLEEIDLPGEWCYKEGKVFLRLEQGDTAQNHLIEGTARKTGIKISYSSCIDVTQMNIKYAKQGIYAQNCDFINIYDNAIGYTSDMGIFVNNYPYPPNGSPHGNIHVENNKVYHTQNDAIRFNNITNGWIINNEVSEVASCPISPKSALGIIFSGKNFIVFGNKIDRTVYNGIHIEKGEDAVVSHNFISNCLLSLADGGGIYAGGNVSRDRHKNLFIRNNIIKDMVGNCAGTPDLRPGCVVGIYLDELANGINVEGNIVFNCPSYGLLLHKAYNNRIVNNVFYNNGIASIRFSEKNENEMRDNKLYNNICFAVTPEQLTFWGTQYQTSSGQMGEYDNNLYYNPYRQDSIKYKQNGKEYFYTLGGWSSFSGQDADSLALNPLFVNEAKDDFHITADSPCVDKGKDIGLAADFDGNKIPQGKAPDIGVYEYNTKIDLVGDVNGDSKVNILDVQLCVNVVLGIEAREEIVNKARQVTAPEEECNVLDIQAVVNEILGK